MVEEKILKNREAEEVKAVARECYATLGFCHGFLGKDKKEFLKELWDKDFLLSGETKIECQNVYSEEYKQGQELWKEIAE